MGCRKDDFLPEQVDESSSPVVKIYPEDTTEVLPDMSRVTSLCIAPDGNVWVAAVDGPLTYDGLSGFPVPTCYGCPGWRSSYFINYDEDLLETEEILTSNYLDPAYSDWAKAIEFDATGRLIVASHKRFYVLENDSWSSFSVSGSYSHNWLNMGRGDMVSDAGGVWTTAGFYNGLQKFGTTNIVYKMDGTNTNYPSDGNASPYSLAIGPSDEIYFLAWGVLYSYISYEIDTVKQASSMKALGVDDAGNVWLASNYYTADQFDLEMYDGSSWTTYTCPFPVDNLGFWDMVIASDGTVYVAVAPDIYDDPEPDDGLYEFDGFSWNKYLLSNSNLPSSKITDLEIDANDRVWISTLDSGVTTFKDYEFTKPN